ncbi:MAG: NACHT domain-containing protein [Cyanobacteria bacterium J06635_15]
MDQPPAQASGQSLNISGSTLETVQIGGIAGRDLNLTQIQGGVESITVFGTVQVEQTSIPPARPLSQEEYRWRQVLLGKVKQFWIKGVLEKSLHTKVLFELGLEERSNLVQKPLSGMDEFADDERQALPEGTTASKVFEDIGAGRTLLILGEPGAGKTVTLLKLAESLISRSENDLSQPLPVVINLSSWAKQRKPIADWLVQELNNVYGASKALGKTWVDQQQLILLLDGLDEVDAQYRNDCVKELNQFIQSHGLTEIVVCSRIRDYEALSERLKLCSAIYVRPLTTQQIDQFLESAGKSLIVLKRAIKQNAELRQMASSPLMLSIVSLAYQDCPADSLPQAGTAESQRKQLLDTYIARMLVRRGTTQQYTREQTLHWLNFLGKRMVQTSQTLFLIERMQPSWLQTRGQRIRYRLGSGLIVGLSVGLIVGLLFWLMHRLLFWLIYGLIVGLSVGLIFGLVFSFIGKDIEPLESLRWSWQKAKTACCRGLIYVLIYVLIDVLIDVLIGGLGVGLIYGLLGGLSVGLSVGLLGGLIYGLLGGRKGPEMEKRFKPNQGIWKSTQHALVFTLSVGLIVGLIVGLTGELIVGLIYGLLGGLSVGLIGGGSASIRHFSLRIILYCIGHIPWNYARFLDHAADRLFLQKVGGGYIFIHRMLLEHFAAMELDQTQSKSLF